jgi:hypothetical protein
MHQCSKRHKRTAMPVRYDHTILREPGVCTNPYPTSCRTGQSVQGSNQIIQTYLRACEVKEPVTSDDSDIRSDLSIRLYGLYLAMYHWHI